MRRETQHVLLLLLGGALVRITVDDTYLRYVRPGHRWLLLAAGAVAVALAITALVADARRRPGPEGTGHDHGAAERHAPWLLVLPVLVIALVAPPALGADAVGRAGGNRVTAAAFPPLPPGPAPALGVAEFVSRAAWDGGSSLTGREVVLTGFTVRRGAAVELARMTIACCAADARPNSVRLVGELGDPPPDVWLRVRGVLQPGSATAATAFVPALTVTAVQTVPAPPDPYEY